MNLYTSVESKRNALRSANRTRSKPTKRKMLQCIPPPSLHTLPSTPDRSFTDDGDDQPETLSRDLPCAEASLTILDLEDFDISPQENDTNDSPKTLEYEGDMPSMSDIIENSGESRTICGLKVRKHRSYLQMSEKSSGGDSAFSSFTSPTASITSDSTNFGASVCSQSASQSGWTLDTQLARSVERRKRIEGRFQRERFLRRNSEEDRDKILSFVKGLLFSEENATGDHCNKSYTENHITTIRDFLSQYDENSQGESSEGDYPPEKSDMVSLHSQIDRVKNILEETNEEGTNEDGPYNLPGRTDDSSHEDDDRSEEDEVIESSHNLRSLLDSYTTDKQQEEPRSPSPSEYSSDSSYYESEAEDEFPELPVKFRSIRELNREKHEYSEDGSEDDEDEDESIISTSSKELRKKLDRREDELDTLHRLFEEATQEHADEIESMERRFREESQKREDLLERALTYAEDQEKLCRKNSDELSLKKAALKQCVREHSQKIGDVRKQQSEQLATQKKKLCDDFSVRRAAEVAHVNDTHKKELANQRTLLTDEFSTQKLKAIQTLQDRHKEDLIEQRNIVLEETELRHAEEMKELKERHERDLADLEKIHANEISLHIQKPQSEPEQILRMNEENNMLQRKIEEFERMIESLKLDAVEHEKDLLNEASKRDSAIDTLERESVRKDEEIRKLKQSLATCESKVFTFEKEQTENTQELQKLRESLSISNNNLEKLENDKQLRDKATEEIAAATMAATASTTKMIRELQDELRERNDCIEELEEELELTIYDRDRTIAKFKESLREQESKNAFSLCNEHTKALKAVEKRLSEEKERHAEEISTMKKSMQEKESLANETRSKDTLELRSLKKKLENIEIEHMQELQTALQDKDSELENVERGHAEEMKKIRADLMELKEQHTKDLAALTHQINLLESSPIDRVGSASVASSSGHSRRSLGREYDVTYAFNLAGYQSRMVEDTVKRLKKQTKSSKWYSPKAQAAMENNKKTLNYPLAKDLRDFSNQTTTTDAASTCSGFEDDERSVVTLGSRKSRKSKKPTTSRVDETGSIIVSSSCVGKTTEKPQTSLWSLLRS